MKSKFFIAALFGALCLASCAATAARAQSAPSTAKPSKEDPIDVERPGFTNGTGTIPVGHMQFEIGYLYSRSDEGVHEHRIGDAGLLRIPTSANTEFRLSTPVYSFTHLHESASGSGVPSPTSGAGGGGSGGVNTHGFGDTSLSAKWRFLEEDKKRSRPSLALTVQTSLPTGEPAYRESHLQPQIELDANYDVSEAWNVQSVVFYARPADEGHQFTQWAAGLNVQRNLSETTAVFLETYHISPVGVSEPNGSYLDTGVTHDLGSNTQLDLSFGTGLNLSIKHDQFVGFGIAHRW